MDNISTSYDLQVKYTYIKNDLDSLMITVLKAMALYIDKNVYTM